MSKKRAIERVLTGTLTRVRRSRSLRVFGDYFWRTPGVVHCRFCATPITDARGPNASFATVELPVKGGGAHRTNMCAACAERLDVTNMKLLEAIYCADIESWARTDSVCGFSAQASEAKNASIYARTLVAGPKVIRRFVRKV